jgi:sugar phosphate isomerase/epimerase
MNLSRRSFLLSIGGSLFAGAQKKLFAALGLENAPLGLEIYSLRKELSKDIPGTLAFVRQLGFQDVEVPEFYGLTSKEFREQLDKAGLGCSAMVAQHDRLIQDLQGVISDAQILNARYVISPWIPHKNDFTEADCRTGAADMNRLGKSLKEAGLGFCYHPHGYEFGNGPGGTLFDLLATETDPACVHFQADVFWIAWPGQDPVKVLERYPNRFLLMHLKDIRKGTKLGDQSGQAPPETSVALGNGMLDFPVILRMAKRIGIQRYYIEDEAPDAASNIPVSLRYLKSIGF